MTTTATTPPPVSKYLPCKDFNAFADFFVDQGWDIVLCGGRCPVQVQGYAPDGTPFYFRARGERISLEVYIADFEGPELDLPHSPPAYSGGFYMPTSLGAFNAGWIEADYAFYAFRQLWADYRETTP